MRRNGQMIRVGVGVVQTTGLVHQVTKERLMAHPLLITLSGNFLESSDWKSEVKALKS